MRSICSVLFLLTMTLTVATGSGCAAGGGGGGGGGTPDDNVNDNAGGGGNDNIPDDNTNDNTPGPGPDDQPALIKTQISLRFNDTLDPSGKIDVGDDLIVFGIENEGVFYLVPSVADSQTSSATQIPNSDQLFGYRNYEVSGKKVALVRSTNAISIYDTVTGQLTDVSAGDITLDPFAMPVDANRPGQIVSDGELIATINDTGAVDDGNAIKVIDLGSDPPNVISFPNPADFEGDFNQVAVDADTRRVAAHGTNPGDVLYVFDIDEPQAAPLLFDFFDRGGFSDNIQFVFDGDYILYQDGTSDGDWEIALLNVASDTITVFDNNPTQNSQPVVLVGGSFGYFLLREDADAIYGSASQFRTAIGQVADAPASTLASQFNSIFGGDPPECIQNESRFGYGTTMCLTPDGHRWFTAGIGPVDATYDYLQTSTGGAFDTFVDPDGDTLSGRVMATDVACSSTTVAFRALRQTPTAGCLTEENWVIGFIVLNRLEQ